MFNEARNQKEAFFTASQRLTDFSKTIRTKQIYCIGLIPEEDKVLGVRRLEKQYNIDFNKLAPRTWFFEGETFKSPLWKQRAKPYQINKEAKKKFIEALACASQKPKRKHSTLKAIGRLLKAILWLPEKPRRATTETEHEKEDTYEDDEEATYAEDSALLEDEDTLW